VRVCGRGAGRPGAGRGEGEEGARVAGREGEGEERDGVTDDRNGTALVTSRPSSAGFAPQCPEISPDRYHKHTYIYYAYTVKQKRKPERTSLGAARHAARRRRVLDRALFAPVVSGVLKHDAVSWRTCHHVTKKTPRSPCSEPHTTSGVTLNLQVGERHPGDSRRRHSRLGRRAEGVRDEARALDQDRRRDGVVQAQADREGAFAREEV
jgi:hypothetical protein